MESIKTTLFEDPFFIYVVLAAAELVFLVMWKTGGRSGRWLATRLLTVAALGGATFGIEKLVVTDREEIRGALRDIAESVPAGRIDHAMTYLDDNYRGWGALKSSPSVRATVAAAASAAVRQSRVEDISLFGRPRIEISDSLATCTVAILITYRPGKEPLKHVMTWKIDWIKRPEGWRIERAEPSQQIMP